MSRLYRTPNQADEEAISDELDVMNNVAASKNLEAQEHLLACEKAFQENIATSERRREEESGSWMSYSRKSSQKIYSSRKKRMYSFGET